MKTFKRIFALALSMVVAMAVLAGCGGSGQTPATTKAAETTAAQAETTAAPADTTEAPAETVAPSVDFSEQVTLKVADILPDTNLSNKFVLEIEEEITNRSNGAITFENYFTGTLGTVKEMAEALTIGSCDIAMITTATVSAYIPSAGVCDLPFIFTDMTSAYAAINEYADDIYAGSENTLGHWLTTFTQGFNQISNGKKPIESIDDIAGMKLRVNQSEVQIATWNALGANATPMGGNDSYAALQQGVVDGNVTTASSAVTDQYWDIQDYFTYGVNSELSTQAWFMSNACYDKLPEGYADLIKEVYQEYAEKLWEAREEGAEADIQTLSEKMNVNELSADARAAFVEAAKDVWTQYADKIGQDLIDKISSYK